MRTFARVHRRSLALVAAHRRGDVEAGALIMSEVYADADVLAATLASLVMLVDRVGRDRPEDLDRWLAEAMLHLAAKEEAGETG